MKILFVCRANVGRSQMAEAFAKRLGFDARSAGTNVFEKEGQEVGINEKTKMLVKVMDEEGIEIKSKIRKQLTPKMAEEADKIIFIIDNPEDKSRCPDYLLKTGKVIFWEVEDVNGRYDSYEYHNNLKKEIRKLVESLER